MSVFSFLMNWVDTWKYFDTWLVKVNFIPGGSFIWYAVLRLLVQLGIHSFHGSPSTGFFLSAFNMSWGQIYHSSFLYRQYYSYVTDPRCKRVGTQCWVYGLCMCIESLICIKFGADIFQHTQIRNIIAWVLVQAAVSVLCVYLCVTYHRWQRRRQITNVSTLLCLETFVTCVIFLIICWCSM